MAILISVVISVFMLVSSIARYILAKEQALRNRRFLEIIIVFISSLVLIYLVFMANETKHLNS